MSLKLRNQDKQEIMAMHGFGVDFYQVLVNAIRVSKECYVAEVDGEVILMFGVSTFNAEKNIGSPWLLGSDKSVKLAKELIADGKIYTNGWLDTYNSLLNFIDERNTVSKRWLKRIGFTLHDPIEVGALKKNFHPFTMLREEL